SSRLGAGVAELELDDLISTDPGRVDRAREKLRQEILGGAESLRESALRDYGIELVDVRLRRAHPPAAGRGAVFARLRSERAKKVTEYRSEGERLASDIRTAAEREVAEMRSEAEARAVELRGEAEAEADRIRGEVQRKDPEFYTFLKKMEDYQRFLGDNKTMLLLSTHRELFDTLFNPPGPMKKPAAKGGGQ